MNKSKSDSVRPKESPLITSHAGKLKFLFSATKGKKTLLMAHSHCTGPGTGPELWVYILCYVLFTLRRDRDRGRMGSKPISPPGPVLGNRFLLYPVPFPVLQCEQYTPFSVPVPFPFQVPCIVNEFHRQSSTYIYMELRSFHTNQNSTSHKKVHPLIFTTLFSIISSNAVSFSIQSN